MGDKLSQNKSGLAGEFAVMSRLFRNDYDVSFTFGNTKSFDIFASKDSKTFRIEVKTSSSRANPYGEKRKSAWGEHYAWIVGNKILDRDCTNLFYAFVWFPKKTDENHSIFIVKGEDVVKYIKESSKKAKEKGLTSDYFLRIGNGADVLSWENHFNRFDLLK